jgi:predicted DNA-binding transcriptional regulator YafY
MTAGLRARIDAVERAAENGTRLDIAYSDEAGRVTERVVRPLGLWFWGKVWTMVTWCELRGDFRMFRLDRIADMQECGPFRAEPGRTLVDFYRSEAWRH